MPFKTKFSSTDSQIKTSFSQKETEFDSGLDEEARVGAIVVDIEKLKEEDAVLYKMITEETERAKKAEESLAGNEINFGDGFIVTEKIEGSSKKKDVVLDTEYINKELIAPVLEGITSNPATSEKFGMIKIDDKTIKMNEKQQIYVAEVSTDRLAQGGQTLVLNGGNDL